MIPLLSLFELSRDATGSHLAEMRKIPARGFVQHSTLAGAGGMAEAQIHIAEWPGTTAAHIAK
jgi:hypothetical protein